MKLAKKMLLPGLLLTALLLPLGGCSCGFDCNNDSNNDNNPTLLTLGFSDSLPEDLKEVVIEVDTITLKRTGAEDVVIDKFTIPDLKLVDAETFKVNLLNYRGTAQLFAIEGLELIPGFYNAVALTILTGDINRSYVQRQDDDTRKVLNVTTGFQNLPGMQLDSGKQTFTIEFGLAQALQFDESNKTYLLTTNGVRIEDNLTAAQLSGSVDTALFDSVSPCSEKSSPTEGNRVYLYKGISLLPENLADVFNSGNTAITPDNAVAPFAVASLGLDDVTNTWRYSFGYIPKGSYTIAFACNTAADDSVQYNGLLIPLPINQKYETTLKGGQKGVCNLSESATGC